MSNSSKNRRHHFYNGNPYATSDGTPFLDEHGKEIHSVFAGFDPSADTGTHQHFPPKRYTPADMEKVYPGPFPEEVASSPSQSFPPAPVYFQFAGERTPELSRSPLPATTTRLSTQREGPHSLSPTPAHPAGAASDSDTLPTDGTPLQACWACNHTQEPCSLLDGSSMPCARCKKHGVACVLPAPSTTRAEPQTQRAGRACDQCHSRKVKCSFTKHGTGPAGCTRCQDDGLNGTGCTLDGIPAIRAAHPQYQHQIHHYALAHRFFPAARRTGILARVFA